jgi:hypothetical protein
LAARLQETFGKTLIEDLPVRSASRQSRPKSAPATKSGWRAAHWSWRYALPTRCPEYSLRSPSAAAGWSMARWSTRCRCRWRARSAPGSS